MELGIDEACDVFGAGNSQPLLVGNIQRFVFSHCKGDYKIDQLAFGGSDEDRVVAIPLQGGVELLIFQRGGGDNFEGSRCLIEVMRVLSLL